MNHVVLYVRNPLVHTADLNVIPPQCNQSGEILQLLWLWATALAFFKPLISLLQTIDYLGHIFCRLFLQVFLYC